MSPNVITPTDVETDLYTPKQSYKGTLYLPTNFLSLANQMLYFTVTEPIPKEFQRGV